MGQPAARVGDPAGHGGFLGPLGAKTVTIGGLNAVRVGDSFLCPGFDGPKPHVVGNVGPIGSMTVKIEGGYAAREGDPTGCGTAGISAIGMPPVSGPPSPPAVKSADAGATGAKVEGQTKVGQADVSGEVVVGTASASAQGGPDALGASVDVSGATAKGDVKNPDGSSVGASGKLLHGEANVDLGVGTDGRRTGVWAGAAAQLSAAEGQVDSTNVINIPFTNYSVNIGSTVGGSAGSLGAAAAGGAYHDAKDDRYHAMGMVDGKMFIGIKFGLDISFGKKATPPPSGGTPGISIPITPGKIIKGLSTVKIG